MTEATEQKPQTGCRAYLPTPEEIAAGCLAIQAEWSPAERQKRACKGFRREEWQLPGEDTGGVSIRPEG